MSLLLTQTRVFVEKSHGSRFLLQVERRLTPLRSFTKSFLPVKLFLLIQVCCDGREEQLDAWENVWEELCLCLSSFFLNLPACMGQGGQLCVAFPNDVIQTSSGHCVYMLLSLFPSKLLFSSKTGNSICVRHTLCSLPVFKACPPSAA